MKYPAIALMGFSLLLQVAPCPKKKDPVDACREAVAAINGLDCTPATARLDEATFCPEILRDIDGNEFDYSKYYVWLKQAYSCDSANELQMDTRECQSDGVSVVTPDGQTIHPSDSVPEKAPVVPEANVTGRALGVTQWGPVASAGSLTVCAPGTTSPVNGSVFLARIALEGPVPLSDPTNLYEYSFALDADGDDANNYGAPAGMPNDFFSGTDRWFSLKYDPLTDWALEVTDATGGTPTPLTSEACVIIMGDELWLIVPFSEFNAPFPQYRVSALRHVGDFGVDPPHDWDGDVQPPVAEGLAQGPFN